MAGVSTLKFDFHFLREQVNNGRLEVKHFLRQS